jgi:hypothetical protein
MPKVRPFHSINPRIPLRDRRHHDNSLCTEGNNIEPQYKRNDTGGYPRCHRCTTLAAQGR